MRSVDIERKFINREITPEDESSIMQQMPVDRWQWLLRQRDSADLARRWAYLESVMPGVVATLSAPLTLEQGQLEIGKRLFAGLAFLIEEIHHLNETTAMDRRKR